METGVCLSRTGSTLNVCVLVWCHATKFNFLLFCCFDVWLFSGCEGGMHPQIASRKHIAGSETQLRMRIQWCFALRNSVFEIKKQNEMTCVHGSPVGSIWPDEKQFPRQRLVVGFRNSKTHQMTCVHGPPIRCIWPDEK